MTVASLIVLALLILLMWLATAFLHPILIHLGVEFPISKLGDWGSSFGALNSFFTAIGLPVVILTLWMQNRQNQWAQEDQHRQRFDASYFELLHLLRETRKDVRFRYSSDYHKKTHLTGQNKTKTGTAAFHSAWMELRYWVSECPSTPIGELYSSKIHTRYESNFGPYFRLLYSILKRIQLDTVLAEEDKARYGNLLRSQLNSYETALVGINGLSDVSADFSSLIIVFHMLKYLPEHSQRRSLLLTHYPIEAFAARD